MTKIWHVLLASAATFGQAVLRTSRPSQPRPTADACPGRPQTQVQAQACSGWQPKPQQMVQRRSGGSPGTHPSKAEQVR